MAAAGGPGPTCVLGIDLGTTSVKAALVTGTERGLALAQSCSRETQAYSDSPGAAAQGMEQDVQKIIKALNECLAALPQQQLQQVTHIGISGQMHGVVFWKSDKVGAGKDCGQDCGCSAACQGLRDKDSCSEGAGGQRVAQALPLRQTGSATWSRGRMGAAAPPSSPPFLCLSPT
uniref:Sedoheptulokinase n=1 Tax=Zonotrichia albicollis TaxID=44394 RepID=A0A8D2N7V4_ZONAL